MASIGSLQLVQALRWDARIPHPVDGQNGQPKLWRRDRTLGLGSFKSHSYLLSGRTTVRDVSYRRIRSTAVRLIRASGAPGQGIVAIAGEQSRNIARTVVGVAALAFSRTWKSLQGCPLVLQCIPAVGLLMFSLWGLGPFMRLFHKYFLKKYSNDKWDTSQTRYIMASYMRPMLLWIGVIIICRAFDPVVLSSEASQTIKLRFVHFVRSMSTVLAIAYCSASLAQQVQKFAMDRQDAKDARNVGIQFIGNTVYTSVWVAAVCLFMELLGFSTQKWITAGGFGTVLLTLAGREIFTNFLSSIMIHATRPFVENEWIQTKIEGQEVSGTVEHVGWWSPTVIRGDDREAVHIPNHKFTVSVVRNLSQKTHWRIKTHFGISHLDVSKVPDIIADMRKVMSKHPSVEQHRLHRRAFFDTIDPDNQALLILVSCFVKTSHFEEYLRVKEIILLDLLRVISHHNARLATPIRSVQRIFDENEPKPYRDVRGADESRSRPYLLLEAAAVSSGETGHKDRTKVKSEVSEQLLEVGSEIGSSTGVAAEDISDGKSKLKAKEKVQVHSESTSKVIHSESTSKVIHSLTTESGSGIASGKPQLEGLDSMGLNSKDITLLKAAFEKPPAKIPEGPIDSGPYVDLAPGEKVSTKSTADLLKSVKPHMDNPQVEKFVNKAVSEQPKLAKGQVDNPQVEKVVARVPTEQQKAPSVVEFTNSDVEEGNGNLSSSDTSERPSEQHDDPWRQETQAPILTPNPASSPRLETQSNVRSTEERLQASGSVSRPQSVEENLVLGVALDGPKRTLPMDDELTSPADQRELVGTRNGVNSLTSKERREPSSSQTSAPAASSFDSRDRER